MEALVNPGFWRDRRVFVTGHTGFKGSWLSIWLQQLGARVTGYALAPETDPSLFTLAAVQEGMRSVIADVRDLPALSAALREAEPEVVLHLAAQPLVRASYRDPVGTYATNVMGTVHLLEAVRAQPGIAGVVVVTSDKCYENEGHHDRPFLESDPMGGHDPYSSSKGCTELVTAAYARSFFHDPASAAVATARAGNVIGGGDWAEDRLIPDLVRGWRKDEPTRIRFPSATRPWQHVLEPLAGYLQLAERLAGEDGMQFEGGWNFGPALSDVQPVTVVADRIVSGLGAPARWETTGEPQPHEASLLALDAGKACRELGWRPRWGLGEALDRTAAWYHRWNDDATPARVRAACLDDIRHYTAS